MMSNRLAGKVIAVAGASSGIGFAASRQCAEEGAQVVMMARGRARLEEAAAELGATSVPCDVSDPGRVNEAFSLIAERFGRLDALLNVAGVARIRRIEDATDEDIHQVIGVNLLGPIYLTRAAVPLMRRAGGGDIINVSSEITEDYMPFMVLYGTAKGGLETFTRMMAHELKDDRIRVATFVSGSVTSEFGSNFEPEELEAAYPAWLESGYLTRVAGPGQDPAWMADALVFQITRPEGQVIDRIHVRSFAPGHQSKEG